MSWATRRRFIILCIVGAVGIAFLATVAIATLYETPSCTDGVQNQGETGVDCGGECAYLCVESLQPPAVLFTKAIRNDAGRIDIIAMVENRNVNAAAKDVPYSITLYGADQSLIKEASGTLELPPGTTVPVYIPGIVPASGFSSGDPSDGVVHAFLMLDSSAINWFSMNTNTRNVPTVSTITQGGPPDTPRIDAVIINPNIVGLNAVEVIVFIHGTDGDIIAASQTLVRTIPAQGQTTATFTWDTPFPDQPTSVEVLPIIPLP